MSDDRQKTTDEWTDMVKQRVVSDLRREAEAHIRSYQARLDLDGWSDDLCVEICESFAKAQRAEALEEAALLACERCREGHPLQKNGDWHNDKDGKDTMINNLCRAAAIRARAKELR